MDRKLNKLYRQIRKAKVVSFDIFDTLLVRPYANPTDVFRHMELLYNAPGFAESRIKADQQAWQKYTNAENQCTNIDEIYSEIEQKYKHFKQIEMDFEYQILKRNEQVYRFYQYALEQGKKVIAISDMFFDPQFLKSVLDKNGYDKIQQIYVSGTCRKLKTTGDLFRCVLKDLDIEPKNILHIGDNKVSDYAEPKKIGLQAYHYNNILAQYIKAKPYVKKYLAQHHNDVGASCIVGLNAFKYSLCDTSTDDYWTRFGFEYNGPACYAFTQWIRQQTTGIKDILFLARDGYTLEMVYNKISKQKTHYIYTPRSLNLLCLLNYERTGNFAFEHTKTIIDYYKNKSPELKDAPCITTGEQGVRYIEKHYDTFKKLADNYLENYTNYLKDQNIQGKDIATVDTVSMFYSGQVLLSKLMPKKRIFGLYYLIQNGAKDWELVKTFKEKSSYSSDLALIEFMMSSPESPIEAVENGKPVYKQNVSQEEIQRQKTSVKLNHGAVEFADLAISFFGPDADLNISATTLTDWIAIFIKNPTKQDKLEFLSTPFAYDPQHSNYTPIFGEWYKEKYRTIKQHHLFKFIPTITEKRKGHSTKYLLFNTLPLWKKKYNNEYVKYYLLGCINVYKKPKEF